MVYTVDVVVVVGNPSTTNVQCTTTVRTHGCPHVGFMQVLWDGILAARKCNKATSFYKIRTRQWGARLRLCYNTVQFRGVWGCPGSNKLKWGISNTLISKMVKISVLVALLMTRDLDDDCTSISSSLSLIFFLCQKHYFILII